MDRIRATLTPGTPRNGATRPIDIHHRLGLDVRAAERRAARARHDAAAAADPLIALAYAVHGPAVLLRGSAD